MDYLFYLMATHIGCAYMSLTLFLARGVLSAKGINWRQYKWLGIVPHVVDTFIVLTGVSLVIILGVSQYVQWSEFSWLLPKFLFIIAYILLGMKAFKKGRAFSLRHFILAVLCFMLVMLVATLR